METSKMNDDILVFHRLVYNQTINNVIILLGPNLKLIWHKVIQRGDDYILGLVGFWGNKVPYLSTVLRLLPGGKKHKKLFHAREYVDERLSTRWEAYLIFVLHLRSLSHRQMSTLCKDFPCFQAYKSIVGHSTFLTRMRWTYTIMIYLSSSLSTKMLYVS